MSDDAPTLNDYEEVAEVYFDLRGEDVEVDRETINDILEQMFVTAA